MTKHEYLHQRLGARIKKRRTPIVFCVLIFCLLVNVSCQEALPEQEECDAGNQTDTVPGNTNSFSKPEPAYEWMDVRSELVPEDWSPDGLFANKRRLGFAPRKHMRANSLGTEMWLYEDEYAVYDVGMWYDGVDEPDERHYEMMVFVDFAPVEFGLIPVDPDPEAEPLPTLEEAHGYDSLSRRTTLTIKRDEPLVYSLVIPPKAFGELGAHDVRIVYMRPNNYNEDISPHAPVRVTGPSFNLTVNYGGTDFVANDDFPALDGDLVRPPDSVSDYFGLNSILLEPPIAAGEDITNERLTDVYTPSNERVELRGWLEGDISESDLPVVVTGLDGERLLDRPSGRIALPKAPSGFQERQNTARKYAASFNLAASVDDDTLHEYRILAFKRPFCRNVSSRTGGTSVSNVVYIRRNAMGE